MRKKTINGLRPCSACHEILPATATYFYATTGRSLSSECRSCFRERSSRNQKKRHHAGGVEYHLAYITRAARQRARRDKIAYDIDATYLHQLLDLQSGLCAISKVPLTFTKGSGHIATNASIDRIDPKKGYTKDNVQLLAFQVNAMKSNLNIDQLMEWCRLVLNNH
jgi:hypothetical protein